MSLGDYEFARPVAGQERRAESLLFSGPHMQHTVRSAPKAAVATNKGLLRYMKPAATCVGCKSGVKAGTSLCEACESTRPEVAARVRHEYEAAEAAWTKEWNGCVKCADGEDGAQLCRNKDCEHLYIRHWRREQRDHARQQFVAVCGDERMTDIEDLV
jgi:hypothetical protein